MCCRSCTVGGARRDGGIWRSAHQRTLGERSGRRHACVYRVLVGGLYRWGDPALLCPPSPRSLFPSQMRTVRGRLGSVSPLHAASSSSPRCARSRSRSPPPPLRQSLLALRSEGRLMTGVLQRWCSCPRLGKLGGERRGGRSEGAPDFGRCCAIASDGMPVLAAILSGTSCVRGVQFCLWDGGPTLLHTRFSNAKIHACVRPLSSETTHDIQTFLY